MSAHTHTYMLPCTQTNVHPLIFYLSLYTELDFVNVSFRYLEKSSIYWDPVCCHVYNRENKTYISELYEAEKKE